MFDTFHLLSPPISLSLCLTHTVWMMLKIFFCAFSTLVCSPWSVSAAALFPTTSFYHILSRFFLPAFKLKLIKAIAIRVCLLAEPAKKWLHSTVASCVLCDSLELIKIHTQFIYWAIFFSTFFPIRISMVFLPYANFFEHLFKSS